MLVHRNEMRNSVDQIAALGESRKVWYTSTNSVNQIAALGEARKVWHTAAYLPLGAELVPLI